MQRKPFSGHAVTSRINHEVLAFDEAEPSQFIEQRHLMRCIARARNQAAETINAPGLLSTRRNRPRRSRAAEQRDELAALHSITSSAVESSVGGTVRPSILAVWALMTSSNLVDCTTGRSAGLLPLRMRPA